MRPPDRSNRVRCREIQFVSLIIVKFQQRAAHLQPLRALDEAAPIGPTAKLAVGHDRKADILLPADRLPDATVKDLGEFVLADFVAGALAESLAQLRGPQQAPHMIGAERGSAVWTNAHAERSGWFQIALVIYSSIGKL